VGDKCIGDVSTHFRFSGDGLERRIIESSNILKTGGCLGLYESHVSQYLELIQYEQRSKESGLEDRAKAISRNSERNGPLVERT
jgi:hypothetical protein